MGTKNRVRSHVEANPGVHFNAVSRNLDIATGQTQYHLRRLVRGGRLHRAEICGRTHYFTDGYADRERAAIALLRRETTRELVVVLLDRDRTTPATLADEIGIARSTVEWHLTNLVEYDLVEKEYEGRTVFVRSTRPKLLGEALIEIDPNVPDRLVDRFSRLVDSLLES